MSIRSQPTDINFLSPLGFKFNITKNPNVDYFVQSFDFPRITLGTNRNQQTPFGKIQLPGTPLSFDTFSVTFKIDEDMYNYFEIYDWMAGIGTPESFDQYANLNSQPNGYGVLVNADLIVLNGTMNPNVKITFSDVNPIALSGFKFDSTETDVNYITATAEFSYREYTYTRIS
jgi:hypothetical protein